MKTKKNESNRFYLFVVIMFLVLSTLACMGSFFAPTGDLAVQATSEAWRVSGEQTLVAAQANNLNAQSTAIINNSSDSPQGGVNIYLQGHRDGEQEGREDLNAETTIVKQKSSLEFTQIIAFGLLCMLLGIGFLNATARGGSK